MDDIVNALKANGYIQKEIDKIMIHYQYAIDNAIPYPLYYALSKHVI